MRSKDSQMPTIMAAQASEATEIVHAATRRSRATAIGSDAAIRLWLAALLLAVLAGAALSIDLPVARFFQSHATGGELRRLIRLAEVFAWGGTVTLIVITAGALDPRGWRIALPLAASSLGAGLLVDFFKLFVGRMRPSAATEATSAMATFVGWLPAWGARDAGTHGHAIQSFPSAHAATAVGLAASLAFFYPRGRWLFALFAALAMVQRLEARAHFCSDVLAGAAVGLVVAGIVIRMAQAPRESTSLEVN
jgi:membrane-associated phospholipid phosphatase